jgi:hypothetical protein
MKSRNILKSALVAIPLFVGSSLISSTAVIFEQNFSGSFTGGGANQFTNSYQAENGAYSTVSIVGGRFQWQSNHDPLLTGPAGAGDNHSATQLSRNRDSTALPFVNNVGIISVDWRWSENVWANADNSVFNIQIGENFRPGAFNPSGGNGGPSFASLSLQARATAGQFRFIAGGGPGSSNFDLTKDGDGFYNASITAAFNNSGSAQTFTSPSGSYTLNNVSLAVWIGTTLVWDNYTHATNIRPAAGFDHVAFGMGNGTNRTFDEAEPFGGTMQLDNIVVSTIPEPGVYAAIIGLISLMIARARRASQAKG